MLRRIVVVIEWLRGSFGLGIFGTGGFGAPGGGGTAWLSGRLKSGRGVVTENRSSQLRKSSLAMLYLGTHWQTRRTMLHLLRILEVKHLDVDGSVIWESRDLPNTLHKTGEEYVLQACFCNAVQGVVDFYYAGMDDRETISVDDTMADVTAEPAAYGYIRQAISSASGFTVSENIATDHFEAVSGILTFTATGGTWGPVRNLFLATASDEDGILISSVAMDGTHFVSNGQQLTVRIGIRLWDESALT